MGVFKKAPFYRDISTLSTARNSSNIDIDMRLICLIFICVSLVNFCSMAPLEPASHGLRSKRAADNRLPPWWPRPQTPRPISKRAASDDDRLVNCCEAPYNEYCGDGYC